MAKGLRFWYILEYFGIFLVFWYILVYFGIFKMVCVYEIIFEINAEDTKTT